MRVEDEWRKAKSERRDPEVDNMRNPQCNRHVKQHHQRPHTQVDAWTCKSGEKKTEVRARSSEATASSDVTGTTIVQIAENRVAVDLGREDLKYGRKRANVLGETQNGTTGPSFDEFWKNER